MTASATTRRQPRMHTMVGPAHQDPRDPDGSFPIPKGKALMDLGLRGKSPQSVLIEYAVRMQLTDVYFIVVESPFTLDVHGEHFSLSPDEEPDDAVQALRQLVGQTIEEARADATGALHVIFEGGARLTVEPDATYEAWNVSGPDGALIVSTPGGKLATWKPQPNADDH